MTSVAGDHSSPFYFSLAFLKPDRSQQDFWIQPYVSKSTEEPEGMERGPLSGLLACDLFPKLYVHTVLGLSSPGHQGKGWWCRTNTSHQ